MLIPGLEPLKIGTVRDISLSGVYLASQEDPPPNQFLKLQFKIGAEFEISGHVCRKDGFGFAVRFEGDVQ